MFGRSGDVSFQNTVQAPLKPPQPPLSLSSGSVATSGIEQNRQRAVLSQLPAGGSPEGLDVLLNKYSKLHLGMFFQVESLLCEDNNYNLLDLVIK